MPDDPNNGDPLATFKALYGRLARPGRPSTATQAGLDFLPDGYADRRAKRRADAILLGLFAVTTGVIGATWHLSEQSLAAAERDHALVDDEYAQAANRIGQFREMQERQRGVAERWQLSASLVERMPRSNLLAEVTNTLPGGVTLSELSLEARRLTPPTAGDATIAPLPLAYETTLGLEGTALTEGQVSDYIDALSAGGYFEAIDLKWVRRDADGREQGQEVRRFLIALRLDPAAEARPRDESTSADIDLSLIGGRL